jgi:hypothetical protein
MRIPVYLAVAQWVLLLTLGLLVIVMYRQLGRVLGQAKPASLGPAVGSTAASFAYTRMASITGNGTAGNGAQGTVVHHLTPGDGQATLVAFVDPTCPSCEQLVTALGTAEQAGQLASLRVLLLMSDPPRYLQISDAFRTCRLEIGQAVAHSELDAYNASATPLLVAIDGTGVVRAAGAAAQLADVRSYIQASLVPPPEATLSVVPNEDRWKGETAT